MVLVPVRGWNRWSPCSREYNFLHCFGETEPNVATQIVKNPSLTSYLVTYSHLFCVMHKMILHFHRFHYLLEQTMKKILVSLAPYGVSYLGAEEKTLT
jgi:hypothetical protein